MLKEQLDGYAQTHELNLNRIDELTMELVVTDKKMRKKYGFPKEQSFAEYRAIRFTEIQKELDKLRADKCAVAEIFSELASPKLRVAAIKKAIAFSKAAADEGDQTASTSKHNITKVRVSGPRGRKEIAVTNGSV